MKKFFTNKVEFYQAWRERLSKESISILSRHPSKSPVYIGKNSYTIDEAWQVIETAVMIVEVLHGIEPKKPPKKSKKKPKKSKKRKS